MNSELYQDKDKRDARARELKTAGFTVRRSRFTNQQLHPMYVEDLKARLSAADCTFGNTMYKTFFVVLYEVGWDGGR